MGAFTVSLSLPNSDGGYNDFIEVTEDVLDNSLGNISSQIESDEFNVGQLTFGSMTLKFRNETAKYSEAINGSSIFPFKRDQTIIKIEWNRNIFPAACGNTPCGNTFLSKKRVVYKGLLDDGSTSFDVDSQTIAFTFLTMDSVINKVPTNFADLDVNDDIETHIYNVLNQPAITQLFAVDPGNISVINNIVTDDISSLENTNVFDAMQEFLKVGNAIMFVRNDIVYVRSRDVDMDSSFIFYGPSSDKGIENIHNISDYGVGLNRCFNSWKWPNTDLNQFFADSVAKFGERSKEISSDLITDNLKRTTILNSYLDEFGFPRTELTLEVPMYTPIVDLSFLNKINIDYPSDVLPIKDDISSRYAQAIYGENRYARTINSLFISVDQEWKILNININPRSHIQTFKIREV